MEITSSPAFTILDPNGNSTRQEIHSFPCRIGRHSTNDVILRDARASRCHAQLTIGDGDFVLEDLQSRHGVFVNGERINHQVLRDGDRVEFGFPDSFSLIFERSGSRVAEIADQLTGLELTDQTKTGGNLARLRAVLEVARALQNSFSVDGVLAAVVDAALVVTNAERGFLLLDDAGELQVRCARDRHGPLRESDLAVPRNLIRKALDERSSTFSMQFHPDRNDPSASAALLELKSVVCVPLVRIRMAAAESDEPPTPGETVGVLYMDSRVQPRDMAAGNRELLETLAIEASTVLENARLLAEDRARRHLDEELAIARGIQQSLLPNNLPETGWLRAAGCSMPSRQVGGDYYDIFRVDPNCWAAVVADVSGKGVSSALVASLLQGAFLAVDRNPDSLRHTLQRINAFFCERTENEKHATVFCSLLHADGRFDYINAGHCAPIVVPINDVPETLLATATPVGLLEGVDFPAAQIQLQPFDRIVIFSDGLTDAGNADGAYFGVERLREVIRSHGDRPCALLHQAILDALESFTGGQEQADDLTLVVLEYRPD